MRTIRALFQAATGPIRHLMLAGVILASGALFTATEAQAFWWRHCGYGGYCGYYACAPYACGYYGCRPFAYGCGYGGCGYYARYAYSICPVNVTAWTYGYMPPLAVGTGYGGSKHSVGMSVVKVSQAVQPPVAGADVVKLDVSVPTDAEIRVNGIETKLTGAERQFVSKGLQPGKTYTYTFEAKVVRGAKPLTLTRSVTVAGGQRVPVMFDFDGDTQTASTALSSR